MGCKVITSMKTLRFFLLNIEEWFRTSLPCSKISI